MHLIRPHDCLPSLATGHEAGAILYTEGDDLYAAMIDSIANARQEVGFESYLFPAGCGDGPSETLYAINLEVNSTKSCP